jgi:carbonic anhydrase/acetyltransferase-like protein (isoleucine patch superfamily)
MIAIQSSLLCNIMSLRSFRNLEPKIAERVYVDDHALVIGDVEIGDDASVWPMAVVRGDIHSVRIGSCTNIQDGSVLHVTHDSQYNPGGYALEVGSHVTVGHGVILHGCNIHDYCLVGMGATVMDGAVLESDIILGAGSLVTPGKILEAGYLWVGSPARAVRKLSDEEKGYLRYSAQHYVRLKNEYLAGCE